MELDELKTSWNALDKRLEETEIVNMRIVKEMITQKTKSAYDRIMGLNIYTLVVNLLIISLVFPYIFMNTPISTTSFVIVEALILIGLTPHIKKISLLSKFNLDSKKSNELSRLLLRYKQTCCNEPLWTIFCVTLAFAGFYISELCFNTKAAYVLDNRVWLVVGLTLLTFALAFAIGWIQLRRHAQQMLEIEQGLKELQEFES